MLHSTLRSSLSQHLGRDRALFYIHPAGLALTLTTDKPAYRPGETITVSGILSNTAALTATVTLHVQAGGSTLINSAICYRAPEHVLHEWAGELGLEQLTPENLAPIYRFVETTIGVTQSFPFNARANNLFIKLSLIHI